MRGIGEPLGHFPLHVWGCNLEFGSSAVLSLSFWGLWLALVLVLVMCSVRRGVTLVTVYRPLVLFWGAHCNVYYYLQAGGYFGNRLSPLGSLFGEPTVSITTITARPPAAQTPDQSLP